MPSEDHNAGTPHAWVNSTNPVNRPLCWKYGHEYNGVVHRECERCGKTDNAFNFGWLGIFLVIFVVILGELIQAVERLRSVFNRE